MLAGLSPTWYTYLEQGRDIRPSPEVLESLARVLQLTSEERRYLYLVAVGQYPPARPSEAKLVPQTDVAQTVAALSLGSAPIYAGNLYGDVLAWNDAAVELYTDFGQLPEGRRNMLWWQLLDPEAKERIDNWEDDTKDLVARFRLASVTRPWDARFRELIADVGEASADFDKWWSAYDVSDQGSRLRRFRLPDGSTRSYELVVLRMTDGFNSIVLHVPLQNDAD